VSGGLLSSTLPPSAARRLARACAIAALLAGGCRGDPSSTEHHAGAAPRPAASAADPAARMTIVVADVRADPTIDASAVRAALRDAETALLSCADADGSTGVVVMRIPIDHDGSVGDIVLRETTTYGNEDTRACMVRIISAMRFGSPGAARAEAEVTLEVRTRFGAR
jgi:hypothetical protein